MSLLVYRVLHFFGLILVFSALGGLAVAGQVPDPKPIRKILSILHGIGMLLLLLGGFGALAKLGVGFGGWLSVKLLIWLVLGGSVAIFKKKPELAKPMLMVLPILGLIAAVLGTYKPF